MVYNNSSVSLHIIDNVHTPKSCCFSYFWDHGDSRFKKYLISEKVMLMISIVIVVDSSVSMETIQNVTTRASEICRVILNSSRGCALVKCLSRETWPYLIISDLIPKYQTLIKLLIRIYRLMIGASKGVSCVRKPKDFN